MEDTEPEIPVAPMADMVFLLLAFLVSVAVVRAGADSVRLPETATVAAQSAKAGGGIVLSLDAGARTLRLTAPGQPAALIGVRDLEPVLREVLAGAPGAPVELRADAAAPYSAVRDVLASARAAGAREVVIASRPVTR